MILIDKIKITPKCTNIKKIKEAGYEIPTEEHLYYDKNGRYKGKRIVNVATPIEIKVEDLWDNCQEIVPVKCDRCGKEYSLVYQAYAKCKNEDGTNYCNPCATYVKQHGDKSYRWNPNLTDEDREKHRDTKTQSEWSKKVMARDKYICFVCGKHKKYMVAHHLDGYDKHKEKRTDVKNGVCLCSDCHYAFHSRFGYGNNTKEQFEEFCEKSVKELQDYNGTVPTCRPIRCYEDDIVIENIYKYCKGKDLCCTMIRDVCNGIRCSYRGKHYFFEDEFKIMTKEDILSKTMFNTNSTTDYYIIIPELKIGFYYKKDCSLYFSNDERLLSRNKDMKIKGYQAIYLKDYDGDILDIKFYTIEECVEHYKNKTRKEGANE